MEKIDWNMSFLVIAILFILPFYGPTELRVCSFLRLHALIGLFYEPKTMDLFSNWLQLMISSVCLQDSCYSFSRLYSIADSADAVNYLYWFINIIHRKCTWINRRRILLKYWKAFIRARCTFRTSFNKSGMYYWFSLFKDAIFGFVIQKAARNCSRFWLSNWSSCFR